MPKITFKIEVPIPKPFSKMTQREINIWISWAENEINEYSRFISDLRKELRKRN